jgi:hypothetical protein
MIVNGDKVDPIQYAWSRCNQGAPLPAALVRSVLRDQIVPQRNGELAAARRATHSDIVRRRAPRPVQDT